jgi:membrane protein DedA with SNARE-associated domain
MTEFLTQVPPWATYGIIVLALLVETNLLVGIFVPTLTMMVTAGALAQSGYLDLPLVVAVAAGAVILGDLISWHTGRYLGDRLRTNRLGRKISAAHWDRAARVMARHGGKAVVPARFVPLLRTLVPHLAGATRVPYRRVAPYSISVALVWAMIESGGGYFAAHSAHELFAVGGPALVIAVGLTVAVAAVLWHRRKKRTLALCPSCGSTLPSSGSAAISSGNAVPSEGAHPLAGATRDLQACC